MKMVKPSASLIAEFKAVQRELAEAEPRKMFGYDALFVNGNMAVGLWQDTCVLKLSASEQQQLLTSGDGKPFMPMPGRAMTGWIELSGELAHDPEQLLEWSRRAVQFVESLPPKAAAKKGNRPTKPRGVAAKPPKAKTKPKK
jgi:TfoX/Sxy family transcriptional regulator of competence genes